MKNAGEFGGTACRFGLTIAGLGVESGGMTLVGFLISVVVISLSGVMAPGPVTAAAITYGTRSPWAGARMAVGHGVIEIPLIFLLMLGLDRVLDSPGGRVVIGLVGGLYLLWMGASMLREIGRGGEGAPPVHKGPMMTGFLLSATNPYFLVWWATVGLNMAIQARELGVTALVLFAGVHWVCDLVWLGILSGTSYYGANLLNRRNRGIILGVCAAAVFAFGVWFIYDAVRSLL